MSDGERPLLSDSEPRRRWGQQFPQTRPFLGASLLSATLVLCGVLQLALGPRGATPRSVHPTSEIDLIDWANFPCLVWTGGTCHISPCKTTRNAACEAGLCSCEEGCVGAEGSCHYGAASYERVASSIRFRNVKFDEYLYAPRTAFMQQLRVTSEPGRYADRWNVYRVPGTAFGKEYHIISPVEFPGYAVSVTGNDDPVGPSLFSVTIVDMRGNKQNPWYVMQSICRSRAHPGAWQIRPLGTRALKWYVHAGSWEVFGWRGGLITAEVGEGGDWAPEPPVNLTLPSCSD